MDLKPYIAELVAFVIMLAIVVRYIWPLLRRRMEGRLESIRSSIDSASAARTTAEAELDHRREMLGEAHVEAEAILAQARETAAAISADGRRRAEQERERFVASAEAEIELESQQARDDVATEIGAIVIEAAELVVRAELDEARQRTLIDEVIAAAALVPSSASPSAAVDRAGEAGIAEVTP